MGIKKDKSLSAGDAALRRLAEERLRAKTKGLHSPRSEVETQRLLHELEVHQVELEMQNEELRGAQEELEISRNKYAELYDFAPVGYFIFDEAGLIREVNFTGALMLGIERQMLADKPFSSFIADAEGREIFSKHVEMALQRQDKQRCEIRLTGKDGTIIYGHLRSIMLDNTRSRESYIFCSIVDSTLRKQLEVEVQDAREYSENIVETVRKPLIVLNSELKILTANRSFYDVFKVTPEETIGNFIYDLGNRQWDIPKLRVLFEEILPHQTFFIGYEVEHDFPGIGRKTIMLNAQEIFRETVGSHIILLAMEDITERKQLADALQIAHDNLEIIVKERTEELSRTNEKLRQEIEDRKDAANSLREALTIIKQLKDQLHEENLYLREEINLLHSHMEIVGNSEALRTVLMQIEQVAATDSTVLIQGETGTGKELVANAIHNLSARMDRLLIKVNCAALPPTLIESELFGREKGAYTGALSKQIGRFELAAASTIFLDEIDSLPLDLQAKLLRVLESGEFERLGSPRTVKVDVRILAATSRELATLISEGGFREDLYYRLNVFQITVPPLRERREDILPLVWSFVQEFSKRMGKRIESIPQKTVEALQAYPWPGNVRELRNVTERAMIITTGPVLHVDVPKFAQSGANQSGTLEDIERQRILEVLNTTGWRVSGKDGAAEILGINPKTLASRMQRLGIQKRNKNT